MQYKNICIEAITNSEIQTIEFGENVACFFAGVVAFFGELGAGKTAFIRGVAKKFGAQEFVCSPTFSIVNEYEANFGKIIHCDMYRVRNEEDLYGTGFFDFVEAKNSLILIEWSENIIEFLPSEYFKVNIEVLGQTTRKITIEKEHKVESFGNRHK